MDYHVILIEDGKPTHHWVYPTISDAISQLTRLLRAYDEVNDVSATIVKASYSDRDLNCYQLLQSQIAPPDRSTLSNWYDK